ncbi:hypothetical protein [Agrobacterium sp. NPDC089420]|uniref:hypothetical protein n=1 Tax=Agrobacterium sp. NPDC089420 TaxID=3363918 RepID=UPI0038500388
MNMSKDTKLRKLETLLAGTPFGISLSDRGPALIQFTERGSVEVAVGNGDDFIEFMEAWHELNSEIATQGILIKGGKGA